MRTAAKADEMGARGEWKGRGKVLNERCVTFGQVEEVNASKKNQYIAKFTKKI